MKHGFYIRRSFYLWPFKHHIVCGEYYSFGLCDYRTGFVIIRPEESIIERLLMLKAIIEEQI